MELGNYTWRNDIKHYKRLWARCYSTGLQTHFLQLAKGKYHTDACTKQLKHEWTEQIHLSFS